MAISLFPGAAHDLPLTVLPPEVQLRQEHMCAQILLGHTNAHGGLVPRQTVLHKVTLGTLRCPTVTLPSRTQHCPFYRWVVTQRQLSCGV